jgi:hypothetical protein
MQDKAPYWREAYNWLLCAKCNGKLQRRGLVSKLVYVEIDGKRYHVTCAPKMMQPPDAAGSEQ